MLARTSVGLAPGKKGAPVYSYEALQTSSELDGGTGRDWAHLSHYAAGGPDVNLAAKRNAQDDLS